MRPNDWEGRLETVPRLVLTLPLLAALAAPVQAAERIALFPFEMINSSMEPTRPDELERLARLTLQARLRLADAGYTPVDIGPVAAEVERASPLKDCNGCELKLARELQADLAAVGWVQKVSNLILNVNLQIRDVETGRLVKGGSVDIRGNTDESWQRGITYLMERRILPR
jgi:hypothetical protein